MITVLILLPLQLYSQNLIWMIIMKNKETFFTMQIKNSLLNYKILDKLEISSSSKT
jgi:hypothetical protein